MYTLRVASRCEDPIFRGLSGRPPNHLSLFALYDLWWRKDYCYPSFLLPTEHYIGNPRSTRTSVHVPRMCLLLLPLTSVSRDATMPVGIMQPLTCHYKSTRPHAESRSATSHVTSLVTNKVELTLSSYYQDVASFECVSHLRILRLG